MTPDPTLEAIRESRRQISRDAGHDAIRLIAHYRQMQAAFTGRILLGPESNPTEQDAGPDGASSSSPAGHRSSG